MNLKKVKITFHLCKKIYFKGFFLIKEIISYPLPGFRDKR